MAAEGYDVLRLIEHNQSCYVSSEYVRGRPLIQWMKYHPNISKEQLFLWMAEITKQLGLFHRCRGRSCYQYVNPYSIIVTGEHDLYLLDVSSESGQEQLRQMRRRAVRESFFPPGERPGQKAGPERDIYGLGRTFQYLLAAAEPEPPLTRREERKFQKIISSCLNGQSKKSYHNIQDIRKHLPETRTKHTKIYRTRTLKLMVTVLLLSGTAAGLLLFPGNKDKTVEPAQAKKEIYAGNTGAESAVNTEDSLSGEDQMKIEMGMVYLAELGDYEKAAECFQNADGTLAEAYAVITEGLRGSLVSGKEKQLEKALRFAEKECPPGKEAYGYRILIKGYTLIDTTESAKAVTRLGKAYQELNEGGTAEVGTEIAEYMASAYEQLEETDLAIECYEQQLEIEENAKRREELYKKLSVLWEESGQPDLAWECCLAGIEELEDSEELRLLYIQMQCRDSTYDRGLCAETIKGFIRDIPELIERKEFQKLQREYDITVEGEEVWVGK